MSKKAFITGITGQDGSYLAEFLLEKDYQLHGLVRSGSALENSRISHFARSLVLHQGDLKDSASLLKALTESAPDEVYHLAAQSHAGHSFDDVETTAEANAMGTLRMLQVVRQLPTPPRLFHASSSEIFGMPDTSPQDENTPVRPATPYGCAKAFATQMVCVYRKTFGLFASNGILYNHESPRRGEKFVTRKICLAAAAIKEGRQNMLKLGNTSSLRDWGDARDYVRGMWLTLQHSEPEDFVFATGKLHSVQEVVEIAFNAVGLDWSKCVQQDPQLMRPAEPPRLVGNAAKAERLLGWRPQARFEDLITEMTLASRLALGRS